MVKTLVGLVGTAYCAKEKRVQSKAVQVAECLGPCEESPQAFRVQAREGADWNTTWAANDTFTG